MFNDFLSKFDLQYSFQSINDVSEDDILSALEKSKNHFDDLITLLSPSAQKYLDKMALKSQQITRRRFGNTMQLYIPLYLSNKCDNACIYCGFRTHNKIQRKTLSTEEVLNEADILYRRGFRNILLVSGATSDILKNNYLNTVINELSNKFTSVSIEIEEQNREFYEDLFKSNLDGVTLYQETYNPETYAQIHPEGKKSDYNFRLNAMDIIGRTGIRKLGIGALLGLYDFRKEAYMLSLHCKYLLQNYWRSSISVSFPRLCENESNYKAKYPVSDKDLMQIIFAFRIVFPDIDLSLSTREPPELRDYLAQNGITYMSAGSRTSPGGYLNKEKAGNQFEMEDTRSVEEICAVLSKKDIDVVWKDWNEYR